MDTTLGFGTIPVAGQGILAGTSLKLECQGNRIKAFQGGVLIHDVVDPTPLSGTTWGLYGNPGLEVDDFNLTIGSLPVGSPDIFTTFAVTVVGKGPLKLYTNFPVTVTGSNYTDYFVGGLDEVAVYPVSLTPQQVLAHYNAGKGIV